MNQTLKCFTCKNSYLKNTKLILIPDFPFGFYQLDRPNIIVENPVNHLSGFLILPAALITIALILIAWTSFNCSSCPVSKNEEEKTKMLTMEQCGTRQSNFACLPDWLQNRKEMIFPNTAVIKGQKLGKGQFGIVFKGALVQGNAV